MHFRNAEFTGDQEFCKKNAVSVLRTRTQWNPLWTRSYAYENDTVWRSRARPRAGADQKGPDPRELATTCLSICCCGCRVCMKVGLGCCTIRLWGWRTVRWARAILWGGRAPGCSKFTGACWIPAIRTFIVVHYSFNALSKATKNNHKNKRANV